MIFPLVFLHFSFFFSFPSLQVLVINSALKQNFSIFALLDLLGHWPFFVWNVWNAVCIYNELNGFDVFFMYIFVRKLTHELNTYQPCLSTEDLNYKWLWINEECRFGYSIYCARSIATLLDSKFSFDWEFHKTLHFSNGQIIIIMDARVGLPRLSKHILWIYFVFRSRMNLKLIQILFAWR